MIQITSSRQIRHIIICITYFLTCRYERLCRIYLDLSVEYRYIQSRKPVLQDHADYYTAPTRQHDLEIIPIRNLSALTTYIMTWEYIIKICLLYTSDAADE